jgi:putative ABC transport system permease protein
VVSVARRNLFQDRVRLAVGAGGVALAFLLILVLQGIVEGSLHQITAYIRKLPAQVVVAQPGVRTMHMSTSMLPLEAADRVAGVAGVARVSPILYTTNPLVAEEGRSLAYVIGFRPEDGMAGPQELVAGEAVLRPREMIVDRVAAEKMGVGLGDEVQVLGSPFRVAGLSEGTFTITNSIAFVRFDDFARLRAAPDAASYLLVELERGLPSAEGVRRIGEAVPGVEVFTREKFEAEEGRLVRDMTAEILIIMSAVGFVIGLAAVALTVYTLTLGKVREFAVLRALGARPRQVYAVVVEQAAWAVALGLPLAVGAGLGLSRVLAAYAPHLPIRLTPGVVAQVLVAGLAIALLSAVIPVLRLQRIDPAEAFRQ